MQLSLVKFIILYFVMCVDRSSAYRKDVEPYSEEGLPKLFNMENYDECVQKDGVFCKVNIAVKLQDNSSQFARIIERNKKFDSRFKRQYLHRLICFSKQALGNATRMCFHAAKVVYNELKEVNLTPSNVELTVKDFHCSGGYPVGFVDYILWMISPLYLYLIYKSSKYDLNKLKKSNYPTSKFMGQSKSRDFQQLKCIQGLRFYLTTLMLINHTKLSYGPLYFSNPYDFERTCANPFFSHQIIFDMLFIIQTYFMISCFLMTNQVLEIHRKHGHFSFYHCFVLYINRLFRFFPSVLVMVLITMYGSKLITAGPHVNEFIFAIQKSCEKSWWTPLLQLGYLNNFENMCVPGSWYMSVDTFYYTTGMIILYFHLNFKLSLSKILSVVFTTSSAVFGYTIYVNNFPVMFKINADVFTDLYNSTDFNQLYVSPLSSINTMCVSIWFGALYFSTKNQKFQYNTVKRTICILSLVSSLPLIIFLTELDYEPFLRPIVGPLIKPISASCVAMAIIGLSRKQGGIFNKVFEWEFAVKMGNFTFSTYIFHFFLVFQRGAFEIELFEYKAINLVFITVFNVIGSYALGILCSLTLEQPFATIKKIYLPQIKNSPVLEKKLTQKKL